MRVEQLIRALLKYDMNAQVEIPYDARKGLVIVPNKIVCKVANEGKHLLIHITGNSGICRHL